MKTRHKFGIGLLGILGVVYVYNASWIAGPPSGEMTLISHRGVHQTFSREGLTNTTCTAERIFPIEHQYIENTTESFTAAIGYGADMIELDVHPTIDGEFVVFHDWTLECRTDGTGRVRDHELASLKALDIGHGYTFDNGQTFPLRGKLFGAMPTLDEVLSEFPDTRFIINIKSRSKAEAIALLNYIEPDIFSRLSFSGHASPLSLIQTERSDIVALSRAQSKACLKNYVLTGWFGNMPKPCHRAYVPVPANFRWGIWGWPNRFEKRLNAVGSRSMLMGPYKGTGSTGIDTPDMTSLIPKTYTGLVWTNKIEVTGPALAQR